MNKLLKNYRNKTNEKGFTLIELMIVVAIIGILAAIAIPNFLGMQEKAKRRSIEEGISSAKSEIHSWMTASLKGEQGVVDYNGDGLVTPTEGPVLTLLDVASIWRNSFYNKRGGTVWSPWNSTKPLFVFAQAPGTGQIALATANGGRGVILIGADINGVTLLQDTVSVD